MLYFSYIIRNGLNSDNDWQVYKCVEKSMKPFKDSELNRDGQSNSNLSPRMSKEFGKMKRIKKGGIGVQFYKNILYLNLN